MSSVSTFVLKNVRGAGRRDVDTMGCNGTYRVTEERFHDKPVYASAGGYKMFSTYCGKWVVCDRKNIQLMMSERSEQYPWDVNVWNVVRKNGVLVVCGASITRKGEDGTSRNVNMIEALISHRVAKHVPATITIDALKVFAKIVSNLLKIEENEKFAKFREGNENIVKSNILVVDGGIDLVLALGFTPDSSSDETWYKYLYDKSPTRDWVSSVVGLLQKCQAQLANSPRHENVDVDESSFTVFCERCNKARILRESHGFSESDVSNMFWECKMMIGMSCDEPDDEIVNVVEGSRLHASQLEKKCGVKSRATLAACDAKVVQSKLNDANVAIGMVEKWVLRARHYEIGDMLQEILSSGRGAYDLTETLRNLNIVGISTPRDLLDHKARPLSQLLKFRGTWRLSPSPPDEDVSAWQERARTFMATLPWLKEWVHSSIALSTA